MSVSPLKDEQMSLQVSRKGDIDSVTFTQVASLAAWLLHLVWVKLGPFTAMTTYSQAPASRS